jgi:prevent-host-death family protein
MPMISMSSREFNQDIGKAKRAAATGPVFITNRNRPEHVLLSMDTYLELTEKEPSIVSMLAMSDGDHIDFEPPRLDTGLFKPAEFD